MPSASTNPLTDWQIEVFYDGACPLCVREIRFLRRLDRRGRIRYTDTLGVSNEEVAATLRDRGAIERHQELLDLYEMIAERLRRNPAVAITMSQGSENL